MRYSMNGKLEMRNWGGKISSCGGLECVFKTHPGILDQGQTDNGNVAGGMCKRHKVLNLCAF